MRLLWIQTGSCGGESLSLLGADSPTLEELIAEGLEVLWHPSLSFAPSPRVQHLIAEIGAGHISLDILCVEGSMITAPRQTGQWDVLGNRSRKEILVELADAAHYVLAVGTCAAYGGVHSAPPNPSDCMGLQFNRTTSGGVLPATWRSQSGLPVINLAGCPVHPNTLNRTLSLLLRGIPLELDEWGRPTAFFSATVHQGCTRNEYHEYDVEDAELGGRGCLFFNLGCQGPLTLAPCNQELWYRRNSKTRAGVPCFSCTSPGFPRESHLFQTDKIGHIPLNLPLGVQRSHYMAYKDLARDAAPKRLKHREMEP